MVQIVRLRLLRRTVRLTMISRHCQCLVRGPGPGLGDHWQLECPRPKPGSAVTPSATGRTRDRGIQLEVQVTRHSPPAGGPASLSAATASAEVNATALSSCHGMRGLRPRCARDRSLAVSPPLRGTQHSGWPGTGNFVFEVATLRGAFIHVSI